MGPRLAHFFGGWFYWKAASRSLIRAPYHRRAVSTQYPARRLNLSSFPAWAAASESWMVRSALRTRRVSGNTDPEGSASAPEGKCYRNRSEPYSKPYPSIVEEADADLKIVWAAYPEDRRRDRKACRQLVKDILQQVSRDELVAAARAYSAESAEFTRSKVAFFDNWLRDRKWQRHVDDLRLAQAEAEAAAVKRAEQIAGWIKARHGMCQHLTKAQVQDAVIRNFITLGEAQAAGCL